LELRQRYRSKGRIGRSGSFASAVGYASIFCPEFVEFENFILRGPEIKSEKVLAIREFQSQEGMTAQAVERVLNHLHIADIHYHGVPGFVSR
jgi:hypothetical protein